MLNITSASDPMTVEQIVAVIYGQPGTGKTSTAFTAKKPLCLDFDNGAGRSSFRQDSVQIRNWSDVEKMTEKDLANYDTVIVDTAGTCLDALAIEITSKNSKMGNGTKLHMAGWGELKYRFTSWVKLIRSYKKDLILIAHDAEDKRGDDVVIRPKIAGGSYAEVFQIADSVGYLSMNNNERTLEFSPTDRSVGKNPASFNLLKIPNFHQQPDWFAEIISQIKEHIGRINNRAIEITNDIAAWRDAINDCETVEDLNQNAAEIKKSDKAVSVQVRPLFTKRVKELGFDLKGGVVIEGKENAETE